MHIATHDSDQSGSALFAAPVGSVRESMRDFLSVAPSCTGVAVAK
jgi:hypothetical protein